MEEEKWDITNEREFMKGVLTALSEVLDIIHEERDADLGTLEIKIVSLYDRALNGYLSIAEREWLKVLDLIAR